MNINYIIGTATIKRYSRLPFDDLICNFLHDFSVVLNKSKSTKGYPDIRTLAFWCRKNNILRLKNNFINKNFRLGLGLIFHITPSNIPINFAYSLIFGLLTGNSNIVKVPSNNYEQIDIICSSLKKILQKKKYNLIKKMITIVRYKDGDDFTKKISFMCDARIIWGGDKTINEIRKFKMQTRSVDISFADRYSVSVINSIKILDLSKKELSQLAMKFYNDTYLVDQNGCSSPQLVLWYGDSIIDAKKKFWNALHEIVKEKYNLPEIAAVDKFNLLFENILSEKNVISEKRYGNSIYTVLIKKLDEKIHRHRGKWGFFYEYKLKNFSHIKKIINKKIQTITYFGFEKNKFIDLINENNINGIDRVVPFGQALDLGLIWDGYDIISSLTRIVEIR